MIRGWLLNARKKPKHVRDNIALAIAGSFTALVLLAWIVVVPGKMLDGESVTEEGKPKAFATLLTQFKEQVAGVRESLPEAPVATSTAPAPAPVVLSASSSNWALSSTTIEAKAVPKEIPIIVVPSGSPSASTSLTEPNR